jgi:hypothetical protein
MNVVALAMFDANFGVENETIITCQSSILFSQRLPSLGAADRPDRDEVGL